MAEQQKETIGDATKEAEGKALKNLWDRRHTMSQQHFAVEVLKRSAGYLPQFFRGKRPLTLEFAILFAQHLKCEVAEFSTRLSEEERRLRSHVAWPFPTLSYTLVSHMQPWEIAELEGVMRAWILRHAASAEPQPGEGVNTETRAPQTKRRNSR
jgi:hypothetical protein